MAAGDLYFLGFETGDMSQQGAGGGTRSIQSSVVRSGGYALRVNPTGGTAYIYQGGVPSSVGIGAATSMARTAETFFTFWFRFADLASVTYSVFTVTSSPGASITIDIRITTGGDVTLVGATTSATVATLSANTWYRFDLRVTKNATSGLRIDGGTEQTATANNQNVGGWAFGSLYDGADTYDYFYDDFVVGTAAFPDGDGPVVLLSKPIAAGNYSDWTDGTGSTYAEVDEVPHDSNTSFLRDGAGTNQAHTFDMQAAATIGITGSIVAVMAQALICETSSATTLARVRLRSGSTDSDSTSTDVGNTSYVSFQKLFVVDPADSAAWTTTKFDAIECGPVKGADSSSVTCTAVYLHVVEDAIAVGGGTTRRYSLSLTGVG